MSIKYTRLGHIALRCKSFEAMREFYVDKLGLQEIFHLDNDRGELWLTYIRVSKGQFIELFSESYTGDNKFLNHSPNHFCFEISDYAGTIRSLEAKGIPVYHGPALVAPRMSEPYEDYRPGMCGSLCAFIQDPEGNDIEIMEFTGDSLQILCDKQKGR